MKHESVILHMRSPDDQDLVAEYAARRRDAGDAVYADELEACLKECGYVVPNSEPGDTDDDDPPVDPNPPALLPMTEPGSEPPAEH